MGAVVPFGEPRWEGKLALALKGQAVGMKQAGRKLDDKSLDQFQNRSRFVTWATAIAIRVGLTELRRRRWRDVSLEKLVADTGFEPSAAAESTPDRESQPIIEAMYRIIGTDLTEKQRTVLLGEIKGMAQEEIARQMGSSRNALYKLSHDARQRLKLGLEEAGFTAQEYAITLS